MATRRAMRAPEMRRPTGPRTLPPEAAGAAPGDAGANVQPAEAAEPQAETSTATTRTAAGSVRRERSGVGTGSG